MWVLAGCEGGNDDDGTSPTRPQFEIEEDGWVTIHTSRRDDDTTEELIVEDKSELEASFCTKCWMNRVRVDYGFSNRKPFLACPKCGSEEEGQ